ncbi:hypothetical protein [Paraliomyxa miuraensis]|uniref:hypothetical protein n=1 Tax=Paraliomyxa miuraensis TaxID=376150 RepID=UPI002256FF89|nr:hypothetical protein [Paraliomyxa miuraensis]MCX4240710.1 hypothetical protein [Paraliomyxa miuraensis]
MSDRNVLRFPRDQRDDRWYETSPVVVRWDARLEHELPVVRAIGTILVARDQPLDRPLEPPLDADDEDAHYVKVGEIHIAKPFLCGADANMAMDALTSDHEYLASAVLDGNDYDEAFHEWFEDEFGLMASGDPVFVLDLELPEEHRDPDGLVAAHAALAALATFGSGSSPLVTFDVQGVDPELRQRLRDEGLWSWVHALRAKRWKHVYVAARP